MVSWRLTNCTAALGHYSKVRLGSLYAGITGASIRLKSELHYQLFSFGLAFVFVTVTNLGKNLKLQSLLSEILLNQLFCTLRMLSELQLTV